MSKPDSPLRGGSRRVGPVERDHDLPGRAALRNEACGEEITARDVVPAPGPGLEPYMAGERELPDAADPLRQIA